MLAQNEKRISEAALLKAQDREYWTIERLAAEYSVSEEEILKWMAHPLWNETLCAEENRVILETRFFQLQKIACLKMTALTDITELIAKASKELTGKVTDGELTPLEVLDKTKGLCAAQESSDKTLQTILALDDAIFGIKIIMEQMQSNADENSN